MDTYFKIEGVYFLSALKFQSLGVFLYMQFLDYSLDVNKILSNFQAEILEPAIRGTLNVLESCKKNPSLRRVVLTSSSSTVRIREDIDPSVPLDESVWSSTELCERFQVIVIS